MKHKLHTIIRPFYLLSFMFVTSLAVNAQNDTSTRDSSPCQSEWWEYPSIKSSNSIIRDDHNYRITHSQLFDYSLGINIHTFVIYSYSSGLEFSFNSTFGAVDINDYSVSITDMEIFDGFCYFCGSKIHDAVDMGGEPYTEGFVGRFSISALFSSYSYIEYKTLPKTRSLRALTVNYLPQRIPIILVTLVGEMDYSNNYDACLVELHQSSTSPWTAILGHIPGTPNMYFSDIQCTYHAILLAAQIKCNNNHPYGSADYDTNHQLFLLDMFSSNGCYHDHPAYTNYNMTSYFMDYNYDNCFHLSKAPMKLCSKPTMVNFYLAFGVWENNINKSGLRVFKFSFGPETLEENFYYRMGGLAHEIIDMTIHPGKFPILLSKGHPYNKGIVSIPPFVDPQYTTINTFYSNDVFIHSLSAPPDNTFIDIAGKGSLPNYLMRYSQRISLWNENSCFLKESLEKVHMPFIEDQQFPVSWDYVYDDFLLEWDLEKVVLSDILKNKNCAECKNSN